MHKIPSRLENPIDNIIYYIIEYIAPTFYSLGFTPNMITTLGNICTLIFIYFFMKRDFILSAIFFFFSYVFDCLDGYIARSYNMVSEFGDYYDHISDGMKTIAFTILLIKMNKKLSMLYLPILLLLFILMCFHLANQEIYYDKPEVSKTLQTFKSLTNSKTKEHAEEVMKYSRFFGCGTTVLIMTIIIANYKKSR